MKELRTKIVIPDYNTQLDLYEDVALALTFSIAEIRDISLRRSNYSKTFTLPGTEINNKLFGGIFNINTFDWSYDFNVKTKAFIYSDDNLVFEGYLKLEKIIKNNENTNYDEEIQYEVIFYDSVGSFYEAIKGKTLADLDLTQYNHTFSLNNIYTAQTADYTNGYTYPLLKKKPENKYWLVEDFQPAFYAKTLLDKIFIDANYAYESDFLNSTFFKKLIVLNNEKIVNEPDETNEQKIIASDSDTLSFVESIRTKKYYGGADICYILKNNTLAGEYFSKKIEFSSKLVDGGNKWDTTNSQYTGSGSKVEFKLNTIFTLTLENAHPNEQFVLFDPNSKKENMFRVVFTLVELQDSNKQWGGPNPITNTNIKISNKKVVAQEIRVFTSKLPNFLNVGETKTIVNEELELIFPSTKLEKDRKYEIHCTVEMQYADYYYMVTEGGRPVPKYVNVTAPDTFIVTPTLTNRTIETNISEEFSEGNIVYGDALVNRKMKQSDFFVSLCKMFNLYIDKSKDRDNTFIIEPRNDFYASYNTYDWTNKIDLTTQEITLLSDVQNKKLFFKHSDLITDFGKEYKDVTTDDWGQMEIEFDNEYLIDEQYIQDSFTIPSTTYSDKINGVYVPNISSQDASNSIYLMYSTPASASTGYTVIVSGASSQTILPVYQQALHTNDVDEPDFTLCYSWPQFDQISYEYKSDNSLYNKYWFSYIQQIANCKMLTAYFDLNGTDIYNINFNDRIWIKDSYYVLNSIIDYSPNIDSLTKVELIQINEGFDWVEQPKQYVYTGNSQIMRSEYQKIRASRTTVASRTAYDVGKRNITLPSNTVISGSDNKILVQQNAVVVGNTNSFLRNGVNDNQFGSIPEAIPEEQQNPAIVIGNNNYINNSNTIMVLGNGNYIDEDQDVVAKIGNMVITSTGFYFQFNLVDPGADIVINPFRRFAENLIDNGADCVKGLSGNSQIDLIKSGQDAVLGDGFVS